MSVLLTGGAGYLGSHIAVELLKSGYDVVIIDNFSNSHPDSIINIETISQKKLNFYLGDACDSKKLHEIFEKENIESVIHLAGFKSLSESIEQPLAYYKNNLSSTISLLEVMKKFNVKKLIFSSSATVYGIPQTVPVTEDFPLSVTNPYGRTKLIIEQILSDMAKSDISWDIIILRYYNPVGAHTSGLIGEHSKDKPNNIMPTITATATGKTGHMTVFGNDYPTPDGTCIRDYIHVSDLANGHIKALQYFNKSHLTNINFFNLGTGKGYSILELISQFEQSCGKKINYVFGERRQGDVAEIYANTEKAEKILGWKATHDLNDMCLTAYNWQINLDSQE